MCDPSTTPERYHTHNLTNMTITVQGAATSNHQDRQHNILAFKALAQQPVTVSCLGPGSISSHSSMLHVTCAGVEWQNMAWDIKYHARAKPLIMVALQVTIIIVPHCLPVVEVTHPEGDMEVISHVSEGGLGPLRQALREGGDTRRGGEGAFAAAHAACLIPQQPAINTGL